MRNLPKFHSCSGWWVGQEGCLVVDPLYPYPKLSIGDDGDDGSDDDDDG